MTEQAVQVYQEHQGFSPEQEDALKQMLQQSRIKQRKGGWDKETGKNKMLSYIPGHDAIATANRIFGFGRWGYKIISRTHEVCKDEKKGEIEYYTADVELMVAGSLFPFPGDGVGIVTAPYTVEMHEKARKEAVTDALKRALRHYGDQFGLSLYDEDNFVEDESGNPVRVKDAGKQNGHSPVQERKAVIDAIPTPAQLRARCSTIGMSYSDAVKFLFKREVPDDEMSPDMCAQFDVALKKKEKSSSAGAGR
jgi:recombination DNA repair RAD52 pathway protein